MAEKAKAMAEPYDDEPPPYSSAVPASSRDGKVLPMVLSQISHSYVKGVFSSPLVRAYPVQLESYGISKEDFMSFIDGFNEAFVASPAFVATGFIGDVLSQFYGVSIVQFTGMGLQVGSMVSSVAVSWARSYFYVKAMNSNLFRPAGLNARVLTTKKMALAIGYPDERLKLLPRDEATDVGSSSTSGDVKKEPMTEQERRNPALAEAMRRQGRPTETMANRLGPLEGFISPLDFDVPASVPSTNLLKKMGEQNAQRMQRKQTNRQDKRRSKRDRKADKKEAKIEKRARKTERKMDKLESKYQEKLSEAASRMNVAEGESSKDAAKAEKMVEDAQAKRDRKAEKTLAKADRKTAKKTIKVERKRGKSARAEEKQANRVRWLVIMPWDGNEDDDSLDEDEDEDEDVESGSDSETFVADDDDDDELGEFEDEKGGHEKGKIL